MTHSPCTENILARKCTSRSPASYLVLPEAPWSKMFAAEAAERLQQIVKCVEYPAFEVGL